MFPWSRQFTLISACLSVARQEQNLEKHYNELLKLIGEIGRDIKPAYTNSKLSADRLRKSKFEQLLSVLAGGMIMSW